MAAGLTTPDLTITVAVATCGRPLSLLRCLAALAGNARPPDELIVVDQAPSPEARHVVERCGISAAHYLEQPRLGLSASRNLALSVSSASILAVTDEDCVPDSRWVGSLLAAFERDPAPTAVTGPVLPLGPRPPGRHAISLREASRPVDHHGKIVPWRVGSGGNFAAPRKLLSRLGGWDERLGTGSPGQAGEDAELLHRILRDGGMVRYEPAAVMRHEWQTWERRLETRWSYGYGIGALCGLWLGRGDWSTVRMLTSYLADHALHLAGALRRRDRSGTAEHSRALASAVPGLRYGLCVTVRRHMNRFR